MRVLLSTYDSRGGVEPLAALGARLQALGAEVLVSAPPEPADLDVVQTGAWILPDERPPDHGDPELIS